ncbi:MAG: hypothetical protein Q4B29_00810 [Candidatus Saccharibacteria bacterium]|nr:hypothetical protein [Candidatus Saccharibacteria bacterium]
MTEAKTKVKILAPFIETINDPEKFRKLFRSDVSAIKEVEDRFKRAEEISKSDFRGKSTYQNLVEIMNQDENSARLALYVPLTLAYSNWSKIQTGYMEAWRQLLTHRDARESFNIGDIYESEASEGEPERVVKCLHLLPWLVEGGLLRADELFELLDEHEDDELFCSCVYDCLEIFEEWDCLMEDELDELKERYANFDYRRPQPKLLHETEKRKAWQCELKRASHHGIKFSLERVCGPFSENVDYDELFDVMRKQTGDYLEPDKVVVIGGSRAKGYNLPDSDYDIYTFELSELEQVDPDKVHFVFDMFWISSNPEIETKRAAIARKYMELPADSPIRRDCLNRLEMDLLQFRLMHKGFPYVYGEKLSEATKKFKDIDGASAFYDAYYRQVATKLYAKYVFIPQVWV